MGSAFELRAGSAIELLAGRGAVAEGAAARALGGGVSNNVVLVEDGRRRFVVKQALARLRVADRWLADRGRVVREWEALRAIGEVLPRGRLPETLFLDRRRFLYAMRAAPAGSVDWKSQLLAGDLSACTARAAGATLGLMARGTWGRRRFRERFGDATAFDQLRTDPYYRTVARRHPVVAGPLAEWIARSADRRVAMVHGDWSPKNILVSPGGLVCIDFECAHYGDPSYDAGFLLNHLVLKAFHRLDLAGSYLRLARVAFAWMLAALPPAALEWYERAAARHLAFLMLARVDGKSPVEYLRPGPVQDAVRRLALALIAAAPGTVGAALERAGVALAELRGGPTTRLP